MVVWLTANSEQLKANADSEQQTADSKLQAANTADEAFCVHLLQTDYQRCGPFQLFAVRCLLSAVC